MIRRTSLVKLLFRNWLHTLQGELLKLLVLVMVAEGRTGLKLHQIQEIIQQQVDLACAGLHWFILGFAKLPVATIVIICIFMGY